MDLTEFYSIQTNLLSRVPRNTERFLKHKIHWDNRLLGIIGARGTGKTTLLLQYLSEKRDDLTRYLYLSADHIHVQSVGLYVLRLRRLLQQQPTVDVKRELILTKSALNGLPGWIGVLNHHLQKTISIKL